MNSYQSTVISQQLSVNSQQCNIRRILVMCLGSVLILLTAHCSLLTARAETPPSLKQRLEVFDDVWQTIDQRYYDANLRGVDWAAEREIYRAQAAAATDDNEFYRVLKQMVGSLHDSHTRVYAPEEKSDWRRPRLISVGVSIREVEGELIFTNVEKNSLAGRSGIRVGDVLKSVDSVPATRLLEQRIRELPGASTIAITRLKAAAGIFEGAANSSVRVGFESARNNKQEHFIALKREWRTLPASISARREGATLIITFDSFAPEIVRAFFQILGNQMRGVRGIVLDLRANRGGSTEAMTDIASAFLPENQIIGKFIDRAGKTEVEASTRRLLLYSASEVKIPTLPIVILTSTATASAAEIFTAVLKTAHHVRTLGTPTCGCVLAVKGEHPLPDGGSLEISELDFQMPDGTRLEGVGVAVDETIPQTRRDLLARRDSALERAVETIRSES